MLVNWKAILLELCLLENVRIFSVIKFQVKLGDFQLRFCRFESLFDLFIRYTPLLNILRVAKVQALFLDKF